MADIKKVMVFNIRKHLVKVNKTEKDLARYLSISEKEMFEMLDSSKMLNIKELQSISDYFDLEIKDLVAIPEDILLDPVQNLKNQVTSKEAKEGIETLDKLADMIIFYKTAKESSERAKETWVP